MHDLLATVAQRMTRAVPRFAREICNTRHPNAWCFPGGPPAEQCQLAQLLRTIVQQGKAFIYSPDMITKRAVKEDELDAYLVVRSESIYHLKFIVFMVSESSFLPHDVLS